MLFKISSEICTIVWETFLTLYRCQNATLDIVGSVESYRTTIVFENLLTSSDSYYSFNES